MIPDIRPATLKDVPAISVLATELTGKYLLSGYGADVVRALLHSLEPQRIEENILNGFQYHVADIDGEVVGLIGINPGHHLYHLFVAEKWQRQGIARSLWQVARDSAMAKDHVHYFTVNAAPGARIIYEKLGFVAIAGPTERNGITFIPMQYQVSG